jgi:DNA-binding NarL/FixJ family response regulator
MSAGPRIRVFCVDDRPLMREGIATVIRNEPDMQLVAEASTGHDAIRGFREHRPDVTLMDVRMPDMGGIDALLAIRTEFANARVIMLTTFEGDAEIQRALEAGALPPLLQKESTKSLRVVPEKHSI